MRRSFRIPLLVAAMLACSTGPDPWKMEGAPKSPPDYQWRTGVEAGEDFWQWDCYEGQRVVIVKYSSACYAAAPKLHKGPCGKLFDFEEDFAKHGHFGPLPEGSRWPNSDAGPPPERDAGADAGAASSAKMPSPSPSASASPSPSAGPSSTSPAR